MNMHDFAIMDRRDLLQRALLLVGSTAVLGACATLPEASAATGPFELTAAQRATLDALADTIIPVTDTPGAVAAGVPDQVIEMMRGWAAPATRDAMLAALARVEALGGGFTALSPARRLELLDPFDVDALTVTGSGGTGIMALVSGPQRRDRGYAVLRELVVVLYYYSEIGLTQELQWAAIPGRWDPSVPLTPSSHAISNGIGLG